MKKKPITHTTSDHRRLLMLGRYVDPSPSDVFFHMLDNTDKPIHLFIDSLRVLIGKKPTERHKG